MEFTQVTIIQTISPTSFMIRCNFCEGRGVKPNKMDYSRWKVTDWYEGSACSICNGKGVLRVDSPDIPVYDGVCHGTGHGLTYNSTAGLRCDKCGGVGVRSLTGELKVLK
jgi:DnaJ-class molecular chaperone